MSTFDDPNRQAVGLDPIWTGAGVVELERDADTETFDPSTHTVADVEAYIAEHPDQEAAVLKAERKGKGRASLVGGD